MNPDRWKQVDSVLQAVLERPALEREAFLRQTCSGDESLEREVRSLLASHSEAGSFLESPAIEVAARGIALDQAQAPDGELARRTISHYHVLEKLGHGGMGVVWKARDLRLDRFVALKFLPAARMSDPERKRRFVQEAKAASALNHPNIVTIYDIEQAGGGDFIAMEYVSGKTLARLIPRKGLPLLDALEYGIQLAAALAAAHAAGIVHRDLKPANVMVDDNKIVKVLDFGLAKLTDPEAPLESRASANTVQGLIVGTLAYMSPEQAEGKKLDSRTDIFSFGAVLYEMITGHRAFVGDSAASLLSAILRDQPKPAAEISEIVPRELDRILTRCLEKDPNRRYQHAGDLKIDLRELEDDLAAGRVSSARTAPAVPWRGRWWWFAGATACVALSFAIAWRLRRPDSQPPSWKTIRLTTDAGLSAHPALSLDGKLLAYSADRGLDSGRDLYIKQVSGGQPIRLTFDGARNATPDFSPDGSKIVFRSGRNGGGIYEMPAFGGEPRLLARDGLSPKFSPDGTHVAYWVGAESVAAAVPGSGAVFVVSTVGGQPQRIGSSLTAARRPIWLPDGEHVLVIGSPAGKAYGAGIDWWVVPTNGGEPVQTGAYQALIESGMQFRATSRTPVPAVPAPECWSSSDDTVIFSIATGDTQNLWGLGLSRRTGKVNGVLKRLTTGAGNEAAASCASGDIAFASVETRRSIWSRPFDFVRRTPTGELERITEGPATRENPFFSEDGRYLVFVSNQSGSFNIWKRELATGNETIVASSPLVQRYPLSNSIGNRIAFSVYEQDSRAIYVSPANGTPEKVCDGCLRAMDWSRDEKALLVHGGAPFQISILDIASRQQTTLVKHPKYNLIYGRFSPDYRWVSFTVRIEDRGRIAIAPIDKERPVPEKDWISIAEVGGDDFAHWAPDGKTLYFSSPRDGHSCFWGQRIDESTRRPLGEPFAVQHLHGRLTFGHGSWSVGPGRIGLALVEETGNIWMLSRSVARR